MKKVFSIMLATVALMLVGCNKEQEAIKDIDGNEYTTVRIGNLEWMVENLKVTHYNDGTPIEYAPEAEAWMAADSLGTGAWCVYDFMGSEEETKTANSFVQYGALYNFYAVKSGKLAPEGWRVATVDDWLILQAYCMYNRWNYDESHQDNKIAKALADNQYWMDNIDEGVGDIGNKTTFVDKNNISGFSAMPSGDRRPGGDYVFQGEQTFWWTSSILEGTSNFAYSKALSNTEPDLMEVPSKFGYGFAVRCVREVADNE
ncbi:MAG: fibrobacter succinogenes major paralogous domain-containing protein [Paludibacteraceae bacterium]|nr:fibrobacter succinogenes major paralogous domain-containing protein [Paludibacteraceae bacterium]